MLEGSCSGDESTASLSSSRRARLTSSTALGRGPQGSSLRPPAMRFEEGSGDCLGNTRNENTSRRFWKPCCYGIEVCVDLSNMFAEIVALDHNLKAFLAGLDLQKTVALNCCDILLPGNSQRRILSIEIHHPPPFTVQLCLFMTPSLLCSQCHLTIVNMHIQHQISAKLASNTPGSMPDPSVFKSWY